MMVKYGDQWLIAKVGKPLMVVLDDYDKENIKGMPDGVNSYAVFDDAEAASVQEREAWMTAGNPHKQRMS